MPLFAAADKRVTDPVLRTVLLRQRIDDAGVEFVQDYSHRGLGKGHSPYAKFYADLNSRTRFMVVSGLPMVDGSGDRLTPGWQFAGPQWFAKKNLYTARIQGPDVELVVGNDDAVGRKKGATLAYSPRLFVGGVEIPPSAPVLLPVDPWNPNYRQNVLEWDYGICKRKLRTVEGRVHGYWVFPANPGGDVLIRYGQTGDYRLKLGEYRQNEDEELIPASVFASATYPFEVGDSATYYPDASPETTSVDGWAAQIQDGQTWATLQGGAGSHSGDDGTTFPVSFDETWPAGTTWAEIKRAILLFDTSGLPDAAIISAAVLSAYGSSKGDPSSQLPTSNVYSSAPASNTAIVAGDYDSLGTTPFASEIAFANWSTAGYNDFTLNADGRAAISLVGVSKFGIRNANYDVAAIDPGTTSTGAETKMNGYTSEQGAGFKPKLVVTYALPPADNPVTAAHNLGYAPTASRAAAFPRSPSFAMGFAPSASRATAMARSTAPNFGLAVTADRAWGRVRDAGVALGLAPTVARATQINRTASHALGFAVSVTRGFAKTASVALGQVLTVSRLADFPRTASHALGFAVSVTRGFAKTASVALGQALTVTRATQVSRTASHALGWAVTASRATEIARAASHALGFAASVTRGFAKTASVTMGFYTVASTTQKILRRVASIGTNRTISDVGTNRELEGW